MKVMCVTKDYVGEWSSFSAHELLTIGQWYKVIKEGKDYYTIILIGESIVNFSKSYFKTVAEIRQDKLKELDI
jgi:hypothetical protein